MVPPASLSSSPSLKSSKHVPKTKFAKANLTKPKFAKAEFAKATLAKAKFAKAKFAKAKVLKLIVLKLNMTKNIFAKANLLKLHLLKLHLLKLNAQLLKLKLPKLNLLKLNVLELKKCKRARFLGAGFYHLSVGREAGVWSQEDSKPRDQKVLATLTTHSRAGAPRQASWEPGGGAGRACTLKTKVRTLINKE